MSLTSEELANQTQDKVLQTPDFILNLCWTSFNYRELVPRKTAFHQKVINSMHSQILWNNKILFRVRKSSSFSRYYKPHVLSLNIPILLHKICYNII